jgi:hypothetical protein
MAVTAGVISVIRGAAWECTALRARICLWGVRGLENWGGGGGVMQPMVSHRGC